MTGGARPTWHELQFSGPAHAGRSVARIVPDSICVFSLSNVVTTSAMKPKELRVVTYKHQTAKQAYKVKGRERVRQGSAAMTAAPATLQTPRRLEFLALTTKSTSRIAEQSE